MKGSDLLRLSMLLLALGLLTGSCENEVDINAPKKDITAAYGILDGGDSLHYVKVNQAFLPQGNAETYAAEQHDRTIYENISVSVLELDESGEIGRSFALKDTMLEKEDGLFKSDEMQTLYYFTATDLDPEYRYRLQILIDEGEESEKKVSGECDLVGDFGITSHNPNVQFGGKFYLHNGTRYTESEVRWSNIDNAAQITLTMWLHIEEIFSNGDTVKRRLDWQAGTMDGDRTALAISGEAFFNMLANRLSPKNGLDERRLRRIDLFMSVEEEEVRTYRNVASATSSIVQHRPHYSNLSPDAVGIFGSVRHKTFTGFGLSDKSMEHLVGSSLTSDLQFTQ